MANTLKGKFYLNPELNQFAIDYFEAEVQNCSLFFLSHYHSDHTTGLFDYRFSFHRQFICCSAKTAHFVHQHLSISKETFFELVEFEWYKWDNERKILEMDRTPHQPDHIYVTSLPAFHCEGSVMFLFDHNGRHILHTGDIRMSHNEMKQILERVIGTTKIDDIYLDTTFAPPPDNESLNTFPSREQSELVIIDCIKQHFSLYPDGKVVIVFPARFSCESLYFRIYKTFKKPVMLHYAREMRYYENSENIIDAEILQSISILDENNNTNIDGGLIHACHKYRHDTEKTCTISKAQDVKTFRLCVEAFLWYDVPMEIDETHNVPYCQDHNDGVTIFYPSHCSLKELQGIYNLLQPERIVSHVTHDAQPKHTHEEILAFIKPPASFSTPVTMKSPYRYNHSRLTPLKNTQGQTDSATAADIRSVKRKLEFP